MGDQFQDTQNQRKSQDPEIQIEELELDPTRRGYIQIPNYFKYYWTPLIGHKAAAVYEMILSFAHGDKDTCRPSLNRLCAHLGMTRQELIGREHQFKTTGKKVEKYHKKGMLEILQEYGLLAVEVSGEDPYARSYTFRVLKNPPLLTPEQLSGLSKLLQESHRRLMERCEADRAKLRNFQASTGGSSKLLAGGVVTYQRRGGSKLLPKQNNYINKTTTTEPTPPAPSGGDVVVSGPALQQDLKPPIGTPSKSAASASNQPSAKEIISASTNLSSTGEPVEPPPVRPLAIALTPGSLFAPYGEQLEGLAARHGVEKVLDYMDKLDWQYRQKKEPPGKPIALLNKLLREGMITPEGYQTPQEREAIRREKARVSEAARAEEACQRQEAEARRGLRAYSDTLFDLLPPERKEPYLRQAARGMPSFLAQGPRLEAEAERIFFEEVGARLARAALRMSDQDPAGEGPTGTNLGEGPLRHENQAPWGAALELP